MKTNLETIFEFLDRNAARIAETEDIPYLEGVLIAAEDWLDGTSKPDVKEPSKEDIRKGIQLAILKGMKEASQPHHQMTPDSLGLLLGYTVQQFLPDQEEIAILDPAVGTGNLLFTVMNYLDGKAIASAVEIDETLIQLAAVTGDLLQQHVEFYRQDALQNLLIDPADAIVADLPYGYYPDTATANGYELKADEGMSFAHHLFIEQSVRHTKDGGYLFLLAPATIFDSELASDLYSYLKKYTWIQAVLKLPDQMFQNKSLAKSVLILQKQDETGKAPKEVLLGQVPSMSDKAAMALFFNKFEAWIEENK